jgi:hypothetical protein
MSISSHYKNIPLKAEDIDLLTKDFVSFSTILGISFELAKQDFNRLFIKPTLWKVVCIFLPLAAILSSYLASVFGKSINEKSFLQVLESVTSKSSPDKTSEYISWLIENHGTRTFMVSLAIIIFSIFASLISYRTLYLFNNKKVESIWKTPQNFYFAFSKIIPVVFAFSLAESIIEEVINNDLTAFLIKNILAFFFYGLLGLYQYFIIFEANNINQSITKSYLASKPYFWKNIYRWLLFTLLVVVISAVIILMTIVWVIPMAISNYSTITILLFLIMSVVGIGCLLVVEFVSEVFGYISFLNLILLNSEKSKDQKTNEEPIKVLTSETNPE